MSKLECICGYIIVDQFNNLSYKGHILPDTTIDDVSSFLTDCIDSLMGAIKSNSKIEWIKRHFCVPPYPTDLNESSMIQDLLSSKVIDKKQDIYQCKGCGRIAIQVGDKNHFKFFHPESDDTKGILNGENNKR